MTTSKNFRLSDYTVKCLDSLCDRYDMNQTEVISLCIKFLSNIQDGNDGLIYVPESIKPNYKDVAGWMDCYFNVSK